MGVLDAFDLSGKVAVVTGGNRGLGEAWVRSLADVGATTVIAARDQARSERAREQVGENADVVDLDVRRRQSVQAALDEVVDRHGRVDILVNNAGACVHRPALDVPDDEWDLVVDVNFNGLWRCSQVFGRHMIVAAA